MILTVSSTLSPLPVIDRRRAPAAVNGKVAGEIEEAPSLLAVKGVRKDENDSDNRNSARAGFSLTQQMSTEEAE